jgi:hypothetical protein
MCVCNPDVRTPWCGGPGCVMPASNYTWCRCCGCGEEFNSRDPELKEKHRYCVANLNRPKPQESVMPLSEGTTKATAPALKPGESEMNEANKLVNGERQADYGSPRENYEGIAKVWSGILSPILKRDITAEEAALMMVGLKLQRQAMKHKRDNLVDAHGYLLVYAHIRGEQS